jgi:hypothetical protein
VIAQRTRLRKTFEASSRCSATEIWIDYQHSDSQYRKNYGRKDDRSAEVVSKSSLQHPASTENQ